MDPRLKLLHHADRIAAIQSGAFLPPIMVDIDPVDGTCNLDCAWCCQAASRESRAARFMSIETMSRLGPFCAEWGVKSWRISGDSEPTLNKNLDELILSGTSSGIDVGLITNGVLLDRVGPEALRALTYLGVSLDASNPDSWSLLKRSDSEGFYQIVENVRAARALAPALDISLKFLRWSPERNLTKSEFGSASLPTPASPVSSKAGTIEDLQGLDALAQELGVRAIVKDAFVRDSASSYDFSACHATPLGGVFDASHNFHLCCDARNVYVLTDDYTRDDWGELKTLWGGERHQELVRSIAPKACAGCAKSGVNHVLEKLVVSPADGEQVNFV